MSHFLTGLFTIDSTSGIIRARRSLTEHLQGSYTLTVEGRDGGNPGLVATTTVHIIIDESQTGDGRPVITYPPEDTEFRIPEVGK